MLNIVTEKRICWVDVTLYSTVIYTTGLCGAGRYFLFIHLFNLLNVYAL